MNWILEELKNLEAKHPHYRGKTRLTVTGQFQLEYFSDEVIKRDNMIEVMADEVNLAVRDLDFVATKILAEWPNLDWPPGTTPGAVLMGKILSDEFGPARDCATTVGNAFFAIWAFLQEHDSNWVEFNSFPSAAKHPAVNFSASAIRLWLRRKEPWIRGETKKFELDLNHPKFRRN